MLPQGFVTSDCDSLWSIIPWFPGTCYTTTVLVTHWALDWMFTPDQLKHLSSWFYFAFIDKMVSCMMMDWNLRARTIFSPHCYCSEFWIWAWKVSESTEDMWIKESAIFVWPFSWCTSPLWWIVDCVFLTFWTRAFLHSATCFLPTGEKSEDIPTWHKFNNNKMTYFPVCTKHLMALS